jgi:phytoene desaturase
MISTPNVIIIGAGFGGLSTACYLAKAGFKVTIIEKNKLVGGRANLLKVKGFKFDMGPSWYLMPDVFDKFFADFNKKSSDYYHLKKLSPQYRFYFNDGTSQDIRFQTCSC